MPIVRHGPTPEFLQYVTSRYAIETRDRPHSDWPEQLTIHRGLIPIVIPNFQRKIVWTAEEVEKLLESTSPMYGTAIFAQYSNQSYTLIDGLQRFATGTALLFHLYPLALSPNPSDPVLRSHFTQLPGLVVPHWPVIEHNDNMLKRHTRTIIGESYQDLSDDIKEIIDERLAKPDELAELIETMFLDKLIALDEYTGFANEREMTNTFVHLNSTGIDLKEVDLLRGQLVNRAQDMSWSNDEIDDLENDFSEMFEKGANLKHRQELGLYIYKIVIQRPQKIFPQWNSFAKEQFDELISFIDSFIEAKDSNSQPYLTEIFECGGLPFTIAVLYFYINHFLNGEIPVFRGGDYNTNDESLRLLRACYRRLFYASIGRIGPIIDDYITNDLSFDEIVNKINPVDLAGPMNTQPNRDYLKSKLRSFPINTSKRVFNACKLPERTSPLGTFEPLIFGKRLEQWAIDHLIPKAALSPPPARGSIDGKRLPNLAPLRNNLNSRVKGLTCQMKFSPGEVYEQVQDEHEFIQWLVEEHYYHSMDPNSGISEEDWRRSLDNQQMLELDAEIPVGRERIEKIVELLSRRL